MTAVNYSANCLNSNINKLCFVCQHMENNKRTKITPITIAAVILLFAATGHRHDSTATDRCLIQI